MMPDLSPNVLLVMLISGIVGHVVLLGLGQRLNAVALLGMAFLVIERFSRAEDLPLMFAIKYVRVYVTILMFVLGVAVYRAVNFGPASKAFLLFVTVFLLGAVWSDHPVDGLMHKGLYWLVVVNGLMLAMIIRHHGDMQTVIRLLFVGVSVFLLFLLGYMLTSPAHLLQVGRLSVAGMNANGLGASGAVALPFCLYFWLTDRSKLLRLAALGIAVLGGVIVIYSGSRGAALQALIGAGILLIPQVRRPGLLIALLLCATVAFWSLSSIVQSAAAERLTEMNFETREEIWSHAMELIRQRPLFGHGWLSAATPDGRLTTFNLHSVYFQVIGEIGLAGFGLLMAVLAYIGFKSLQVYRLTVQFALAEERYLWYLSLALMGSILARGVAETGPFTGTQGLALMLPFSIGLIDAIPRLVQARYWMANNAAQATPGYADGSLAPA